MSSDPSLVSLIVHALTGEVTDLASGESEPIEVLIELGWSVERIQGYRDARLATGQSWPVSIPAAERGRIGAAQLHAACQVMLAELGLAPVARTRDRSVPLSTHDRALLADRPPHHGTVG